MAKCFAEHQELSISLLKSFLALYFITSFAHSLTNLFILAAVASNYPGTLNVLKCIDHRHQGFFKVQLSVTKTLNSIHILKVSKLHIDIKKHHTLSILWCDSSMWTLISICSSVLLCNFDFRWFWAWHCPGQAATGYVWRDVHFHHGQDPPSHGPVWPHDQHH